MLPFNETQPPGDATGDNEALGTAENRTTDEQNRNRTQGCF